MTSLGDEQEIWLIVISSPDSGGGYHRLDVTELPSANQDNGNTSLDACI